MKRIEKIVSYSVGIAVCIFGIALIYPIHTVEAGNSKFGKAESVQANAKINIGSTSDGIKREDPLLVTIKGGVNWALGIMGLIALIMLVYGGILMVTAGGDDGKYQKGFTILKSAAIGLAIIGVAWFVVSMALFLVTNPGGAAEGTTAKSDQG